MRGLIVGVVLALAWAAPAAARPLDPSCTDTFQVVGASRDWNTAANWTNGIPGPADDVCILAGIPKVGTATPVIHSLYAPDTPLELAGDFTVTAGATVQSLAVSAGTVTVGGPLAAGSLDLSGGTVSSGSDGTLGSLVWSGGTLGGPGPTTVSGAATLVGGTLAGPLRLAGASTLSAGPGIGGTGALVAAGPLTVHAPAAIAAPFTNAGTVSVDGGALRLTGGGSGAGSYTLAAGAALDWAAGAFTLSAPHIGGAGTARVSGAAVSLTGAAQLAALDVSGGSLAVTGTLDAGPLSLSGGSLAGAGTTTATALNVTGTGATLADGTLAVAGASTLAGPLEIDGRLENAGVMDIPGDSGLSGTGLLVNTGTVRKSAGAGVTLIGVPLDNDGVLDAGTGTLRLTGGSGIGEASTGTYAAGPGATIDWRAGAYALSSPVASGPGTALVSGGTLIVTGPARFATLVLAAGGAQLSDPLTADTVSLGAATLSAAAMTLGHLSWTAGTLSAPAAGTPGTATAGGLTLSGTATKTLRHTTLALTGDSVVDATGGPLVLADGAAVRNGGLLDFRTDASVTGAGTLTNTAAGTLRKSAGTGTTAIGLALDNQGTVDVRTGTLQVAGLAGAALGGTYELAGTLLVPGLAVTANAGTLRLGSSGGLSDGTGDALAGLATNTGTLELGGHDLALAGGLANSGTVGLGGGTLTVARDYVQSAGLTRLDGGTLRAATPVQLAGGRLTGTGTVAPGLVNAGTVAPGAPLTVSGDYRQAPAGALTAPAGRLAVSGTAALDGTLAVDPAAVVLSDGATFPLLTAAAVHGQWAAPADVPGYRFGVGYTATGATLTARAIAAPVPVPTVSPVPTVRPADCCDGPPAPVAGQQATADAAAGKILAKLPGADQFTAITQPASLPSGTVVDARHGTVTLTAASSFTDPKAPPTEIRVAAAIFAIRQQRAADGHTAVTDLLVKTPPGAAHACVPRKGMERARQATIRRIRATVSKGVVRALGAAAVLTTRDASFSMRDRCDGTVTRVVRGKGTVFDRATGRRARLRAHQAYVARARLFTIRQARLRKVPRP